MIESNIYLEMILHTNLDLTTETDNELSFRGRGDDSQKLVLTIKLVKTAKNCPKKNFTPFLYSPLKAWIKRK